MLISELSNLWKNKQHHVIQIEEPSILKICYTAAHQTAQLKKDGEDAANRKNGGVANLMASLFNAMQVKLA